MFHVEAGAAAGKYCDGVGRRSFLRVGVAGMASLSLADVLRAREETPEPGAAKDTAVILIWLDGGPSHLDLYDLKPDAPPEFRGIWKPIPTNVPGIEVSELFPRQARVADKLSIIRTLHHDSGDHFAGAHHVLTGRGGASGADTTPRSPGIGAIASKLCGPRRPGIPAHIGVPYAASVGIRPGYFGGNYLGVAHDPFMTDGDPNSDGFRVQNLDLAQPLTVGRLEDRRALLAHVDKLRRDVDASGAFGAMDRFQRQAFDLVTGPAARRAFDLSSEDPRVRELYGRTHWGQCVLLSRRLVEAGATFVTLHLGGWDHHWDLQKGMENYLPQIDRAVAALFADLDARGLLSRTLVMVMGEFSRTPRMNDGSGQGTPGRDHWGNAMFCVLGGGGVQGGRIVGVTDARGENPKERPVSPGDLHKTIYRVLGIDPATTFIDFAGRPVAAVDHGAVIEELF